VSKEKKKRKEDQLQKHQGLKEKKKKVRRVSLPGEKAFFRQRRKKNSQLGRGPRVKGKRREARGWIDNITETWLPRLMRREKGGEESIHLQKGEKKKETEGEGFTIRSMTSSKKQSRHNLLL